MDLFSISELSRYSGVKQHNIRMWEQRYKALKPKRSEGNTRYYDGSQLRRLLNIVSLMGEHKVSDLCEMPDKKIFGLVQDKLEKVPEPSGETNYYVSQLLAAGLAYDEPHFEKIFSHCLLRLGMKDTYTNVVYPMLVRIGLMWSGDTIPPATEHFISNLLRQKLFTAIDSLPPANKGERWLLFLKENEFHEIGLLLANYVIRQSGRQVIYLGGDVPFLSLAEAIRSTQPHYLLMFLVHKESQEEIHEYLRQLNSAFNGKKIYIASDETQMIKEKLPGKIRWLGSIQDLENAIHESAERRDS